MPKITELTVVTSSNPDDLLVIERDDGTKAIEKSNFTGYLNFYDVAISGTPSQLVEYESWDSNEEYGYYFDITLSGVTSNHTVDSFVVPIDLLNQIAPYVETDTNCVRIFLKSSATISSTLINCVLRGV